MRKVLLLNEAKDPRYGELLANLAGIEDVLVATVKNLAEFEAYLKENSVYLLVLAVEKEPSSAFLGLISKSRNLPSFRDARFVSIHKKFLDSGIQKALMAGAKTIYLEPVDHRSILHTLTQWVDRRAVPVEVLRNLKKIQPTPCEIDVFGRIGKLFTDQQGDLQIETDAELKLEQGVRVRSQMAEDLGRSELFYSVSRVQNDDIYYNYRHSYRLSWKQSPELGRSFTKWIEKNKKGFSLPKTKVLWIRELPLGLLENALNKTIFSVHVQNAKATTLVYLTQLNPRILIRERLPTAYLEVIQKWLTTKQPGEVLLVSTEFDSAPGWNHIAALDPQLFAAQFVEQVKPFLNQRLPASIVQAKYLDRKSNHSRFTLKLSGQILEVEPSSLLLELDTRIELGTIVYLNCPPTQGRDRFGFYVKILACEETLEVHSGCRLTCDVIPISDRPELASAGWSNWGWDQLLERAQGLTGVVLPSQKHKSAVFKAVLSKKAVQPPVFFLKRKSWNRRTVGLWISVFLLLIGAAFLIWWWSQNHVMSTSRS